MCLEPLKQLKRWHDGQRDQRSVTGFIQLLRMVKRLRAQVFGQPEVAFERHLFRVAITDDGDAQGMLEIRLGIEFGLGLKFFLGLNGNGGDSVAAEGSHLAFQRIPCKQVPPVSVLLE